MFIVSQLLWGLVCIHLFWFYFFITGTLIRSKQQPANNDETPTGPAATTDLVITTVTGMAATGFVLLLFGFIGLLSASAFVLWLTIEGLLFKVLRDENVLGRDFWLGRLKAIKRAWSLPALSIYFIFLIISLPAILPPTQFDSTIYHLAYPVEWANAGRIYVDEFFRAPYYANNFHLLYALLFALKLGPVCQFLTWLCGLLTVLGVYAVIAQEIVRTPENSNKSGARPVSSMPLIISLGLALSPVVLRYVNTGYVDVPIGLFLTVAVLCTYLGLQGDARKYELEFIFIAAFCVGMKITLILFLPLFFISLALLLTKKRRQPLWRTIALLALLLALSAPWYLRNFIRTGDPISPTLNMLFGRRDPIWTRADYAGVLADLKTAKDPVSLLRLPVDLFWNTSSKNFREYGTSPVVVLLYVPFIMAVLLVFSRVRRRLGRPFVYLNVALLYLLAYWLAISSFARYFLPIFPLYAVYIGVCFDTLLSASMINQLTRRARRVANLLVSVMLVLLMLYPSPMALSYYQDLVQSNYLEVAVRFRSYREFLKRNLAGYVAAQYIIANLHSNHNQDERVLTVGFENLPYYFRKNRIVSFGDWFGLGRYSDLYESIDQGDLSSYLNKFNVGAVLVNLTDKHMDDARYASFTRQLEQNHFVVQPTQESATAIYMRTKSDCAPD